MEEDKKILGLDTGTNSLGWAVVTRHADGTYTLERKGSLIFQEGVKIEKGIESSRASERTGHRALRRQYFRRRLRKIEVLRVLVKYGLCPPLTDDQLREWHNHKIYPMDEAFMAWQRTDDTVGKNPYAARHRCLHEKLDMGNTLNRYTLGRAMYHLAQRRGFLSNRLEQSEDEEETGAVKTGISDLTNEMRKAGFEYIGDYFYSLYSSQGNRVRLRCRYTDRESHYEREFHEICRVQHLDDDMAKDLERALYFQRPLKSQRHGVGKCTFEPGKQRCADSHPDFEEFRVLAFVNNIKVKGPYDKELRALNAEELGKIRRLFFRKSKPNFDFEDIAKAIAGKGKYAYIHDNGDLPYKFNYRMSQGVPGAPLTAQLIGLFGDDWRSGIAEVYTANADGAKSIDNIVDEVWNVLYSFSSKEKVAGWGRKFLQLDDEQAKAFSGIRLSHQFASLSLKAIRKILPFLRQGLIYSHAVMLANIPSIVGKDVWEDAEQREYILSNVNDLLVNSRPADKSMATTIDFCIKDFLLNNYHLRPGAVDRLYHPSMIETYRDAQRGRDGVYQLGSPRTNAVRNPMAMRSLNEIRRLVNRLLRERVIDNTTEVHIEYSRELNDANRRMAIARYQNDLEKQRQKYAADIKAMYKKETGKDIEPTDADIRKFKLWEEQGHICLYTGNQIGITDFIGPAPGFDIEHTVPQSVGGDSTMMNLTLCDNYFNRYVKGAKLPSQLANHDEIMVRIEPWKEKVDKLTRDIDRLRTNSGMDKAMRDRIIQKKHLLRLERDYWRGKYERFTMTEVPEGFSLRQGIGIGLVSKYAGLYLKSLFHKPDDRRKSNVRVVKGATTAEFRRMWGLQAEYEKKSRDNHCHHCIDAITIACIGKAEYDRMAQYYHDEEQYEWGRGMKPQFPKPWPTFTQDVLSVEDEVLVAHHTPDSMPKKAKKMVVTPKGKFMAKGDSARGKLHNDTYYGAIERDGQLKYVVRRPLSAFTTEKDLKNIVDDAVRQKVLDAVARKGFKEALSEPVYMNEAKGIVIRKVRCYVPSVVSPLNIRQQRDVSAKDYKRQYHVANDSNYCMAIYEGMVKGKAKRAFEIVNNLEAAEYYKRSNDRSVYSAIVPSESSKGYPLKYFLKVGTMVLLYEKTPTEIDFSDKRDVVKRLYKVVGLSSMTINGNPYGVIKLRFHQEARQAKEVKFKNGAFKNGEERRAGITMLHTQLCCLVAGADFEMDVLGEISLKQN